MEAGDPDFEHVAKHAIASAEAEKKLYDPLRNKLIDALLVEVYKFFRNKLAVLVYSISVVDQCSQSSTRRGTELVVDKVSGEGVRKLSTS